MPADRTSSAASFAEAQALGLPLSSHGARHAPSIARGLACQTCRKRKLKCDGAKPACGACARSATIHGDDVDVLVCSYDDPAVKKKRASPTSAAKVAALEAEVAELKAALSRTRLTSPPSSFAPTSAPTDFSPVVPPPVAGQPFPYLPSPDSSFHPLSATYQQQQQQHVPYLQQPTAAGPSRQSRPATSSSRSWCGGVPPDPSSSAAVAAVATATEYGSTSGASPPFTPPSDPLFDLFYPGWPRDLPVPEVTHRLIDVYFAKPHMCRDVVNEVKFRTAMTLPPTSDGFPHTALIHIMCAIAALMVPDDYLKGETYWRSASKPVEYHLARCKLSLGANLGFGPLFQTVQVHGLLCYVLYTQARWIELWQTCGQATRISTPLGLNHVRAANDVPQGQGAHFKGHLLRKTDDDDELNERAATFFICLFADRCASASTGWPCSISDIDITTVIPTLGAPYPRGDALTASPLSIHNPSFFVQHPPHLVGPQQLYSKAVVLLGKTCQFNARAPYIATTSGAGSALNDAISDLRLTDAFKRTDSMIRGFIASIPRGYQFQHRPLGSGAADVLTETRLCLVHGMAHASMILLHEPYVATLDDNEPSLRQCVASANEILRSIFLILGTSYEIALFSPFISYCWACAGRTFIRQIGIKQVKGVTYGVDELRSNVETILVVLKAHRTPLGDNTHDTLKLLLDSPMSCLPRPFLSFAETDGRFLMCHEPLSPTPLHEQLGTAAAAAATAAGNGGPWQQGGGGGGGIVESPDGPRFYELSNGSSSVSPPGSGLGSAPSVVHSQGSVMDADSLSGYGGSGGGGEPPTPSSFATRYGGEGGGMDVPVDAYLQAKAVGGETAFTMASPGDWYAGQNLQGLEQLLQLQ
ncbi:uncharacterized protein RHOBADRAFT_54102 [Rhodotorula graminis WP1]|uniref:Zn(2)-C6 fungal-type domain-containing protein n=1 Tax=Rhodotorula graminis (strain WP1) TaxID=578459 RepID=A0A194S0X4_RHOGW|nr:uncharacterized protein RHOBADRAFT_54102 [Rhodotorula graminis WP1]KPV74257.1 hypothetical protein RHOBADRAFT_54102 [Rhodotorula graminis WP1]